MSIQKAVWPALLCVFLQNGAAAQNSAPAWMSEGPFVDKQTFSLNVPIETAANKIYVEVAVGDRPMRFVLDTGSPSMIDSAIANELGLPVVGRNTGRDSHGAEIETTIVQADVTVGEVAFQNVPLFAADFSTSKAAQCFIGDGVLGSEILPLCAWQIDVPNSTLRCATRLDELDHVAGADKLELYDYGYPHMPFFDVTFARDASSKAMFDTGSPALFTLSPPDFEGARKSQAIANLKSGYGSLGASLGGQAPNVERVRGELQSLGVGGLEIGRVNSVVRESPPSLIGASILDNYIVTLDARSNAAYFESYKDRDPGSSSFGFSLGFDNHMFVSLVWEDSDAERAGLRVGQQLTSINGAATETSCDGMLAAIEAMNGDAIEVAWEGGSATLGAGKLGPERSTAVKRVLVFGASGRIGQHIVAEGLARGYSITGVSRDPQRLAEFGDQINVETGDILDRERTRELIADHDAVIVSIGGTPQNNDPETYIAALAAQSLIEVLQTFGDDSPRLIFVGNLFTLIFEDGKTLLELGRVDETHPNYAMFYGHQIALDLFRASEGVNWTVASPPNGLRLEGRTGNVQFGGDELVRNGDGSPAAISREDYAYAIYEVLESGNYIRQRFNVGRVQD